MWPRMVAVRGGDAPPGTSTSQPATPLHSSSAPISDGGTALRPLSLTAPRTALNVHFRAASRAPIRASAVMLSPSQQAFADKLDAKTRLEKGLEKKYKPQLEVPTMTLRSYLVAHKSHTALTDVNRTSKQRLA